MLPSACLHVALQLATSAGSLGGDRRLRTPAAAGGNSRPCTRTMRTPSVLCAHLPSTGAAPLLCAVWSKRLWEGLRGGRDGEEEGALGQAAAARLSTGRAGISRAHVSACTFLCARAWTTCPCDNLTGRHARFRHGRGDAATCPPPQPAGERARAWPAAAPTEVAPLPLSLENSAERDGGGECAKAVER